MRVPRKLLDELESWITLRKFGSLHINFQDGKIVNVNRVESIKVDMLGGHDSVESISASISTNTPMIE